MNATKLTLDTSLLLEYWKKQDKYETVESLLLLAEQGKVDLVATARIREDVPCSPLSEKVNELLTLNINKVGSVIRIGHWVLGRDMLGNKALADFYSVACEIAKQRGKKPPDWRDWDHIHAHYLLKRDVFLTWDKGIICLAKELREKFGIEVMTLEEYLSTVE